MSNNIADFEKLCRFCGIEKTEGKFIFSFEAAKTGLLSKIKCLFPEEIELMNAEAMLPKFICNICETNVNYFHGFRISVKLVQQALQKKILVKKACVNEVTPSKTEHVCPASHKLGITIIRFNAKGSITCDNCNSNLLSDQIPSADKSSYCVCSDCGFKDETSKFFFNKTAGLNCPKCLYAKKKRTSPENVDISQKKFECDVCKKTFCRKSHLHRHCLTHFGTKPFTCQDCGTSFTQKCSLKTHMLIHKKTNPFSCKWCGQQFRLKQTMANHVMSIHGVVSDVSSLYECDKCKKKFVHKGKLRRHYRSHSGEKPFKCDLCEKTFTQRINLKTHYKKHESENQFPRIPPVAIAMSGNNESDIVSRLSDTENDNQFSLLGTAKKDDHYSGLSQDVLTVPKENGHQFTSITQTLNDADQGKLIQELLNFDNIPAENDTLETFSMVDNPYREENVSMKPSTNSDDMYFNGSSSSYMIYSSNSVLYEVGDVPQSPTLPAFSRLNSAPKHELSL